MTLIYLSCAWVAGILLGARFNVPLPFILIGLIPLPLIFSFRRHRKTIILVSLCLFAFFGGSLRFQASQPTFDENHLSFYNEQEAVVITGLVNSDPELSENTRQLQLSVSEIEVNQARREASGTVLLFVPRYSTYRYGDRLLVTGKLNTPSQLNDFDYPAYLAQRGIYSTMLYPQIEILERDQGLKPFALVYGVRNRISQTLTQVLPEPQASLAQGITLGLRGNIPTSLKDDFSRTGTSHLLAISGLHLSILAGILVSTGIWLWGKRRYAYVWVALGIIWLYASLTGLNPPIIRAGIMVSLFLVADLLGRQRSAVTALAFAAAIMVGIEPQILWSASFQMSFMAMIGLIFITPLFQDLGRRAIRATIVEDKPATAPASVMLDSLSVSLGAIIAVGPLIAYHFGIISLVGPPATFLALPALPGIIIASALAGGLGFLALSAAQVVGWAAWTFLSYLLVIVNAFAAIPLHHIEVTSLHPGLVWAYYAGLGACLWFYHRRQQRNIFAGKSLPYLTSGAERMPEASSRLSRKWLVMPLLVAAIVVTLLAVTMPDNKLHVSFLNVGQGDAILIQQGNQQVLVDGGPSPQAIGLELGRKMPFWDRTIELVVLTHPSADHVSGLLEVLKRYNVKRVLYPDLDFNSGVYDEWLRLLGENGIRIDFAEAGQEIDLGRGTVIEVLNPQNLPLSDTDSDVDNNAAILRLSKGEVSFLLTADLIREGEHELIYQRAIPESTILKVGHHGSATSTTPELLSVASPQLAVISVGAANTYGHPTDEVMTRLTEQLGPGNIYRTDEDGTIEFITDGEGLWVRVGK